MLLFKRLILFFAAIAVIGLAITISGFNTEIVKLNLYFFQFDLSLGFVVISTLFIGLLIGLFMALFSFYMPLKSQIRQLSRKNQQMQSLARLEKSDD